MAFRAPRYSYVHAAREVGVSAITITESAHADFPLNNLIDDRAGTIFKWDASHTGGSIIIDLGASFDTGINRVIIPANHNLTQIRMWEDSVPTFDSPPDSLGAAWNPSPGVLDDHTITASTKRYLRLSITGTGQWQLPQFVLTKLVTLTVGPDLGDSPDEKRPNVVRQIQPTGLSPTVQLGPDQRYIEYDYSPLEGDDLTAMEGFVNDVGMSKPFWVDPASFSSPPETDEPVLWMKFDEMPTSSNTILVPMSNARSKTYSLRLIESLD